MNQKGFAPILIVILVAAALLGGYFIYQKPNKPKTIINPEGYSGPPPEKISILKPKDECKESTDLCNLILQIRENMEKSNYALLLNLQEYIETTCGGMYKSVCEGAKEGEKRKGYLIGPQNAEFDTASRNSYLVTLSEYIKSESPLDFQETIIEGANRVTVLYINQTTQKFLAFNLLQIENEWKIETVLFGPDYKVYLKTSYPTLE